MVLIKISKTEKGKTALDNARERGLKNIEAILN